ncbi:hypothetical protein HGRIS_009060 [Hohenbuehelia grisea]|uniref:2-isopropylmalate synthase n=1 Tax=Hohenbuehelia grisea TaxID=104357 RepID=A0ABR3J1D8_9AGAR
MPMLADPSTKYLPYPAVNFPEGYVRQWPTRRATAPPTWLSTDLRDGNQALVNPMNNTTKLELFRLLANKIGFKQIEIAYPSASESDYKFCRSLVENNEIPDDVTIQIMTPCRLDLIPQSVASVAGAREVIVLLYNAVSPVFREVVFRNSKEKTIELVLNAVRLLKKLTEEEEARSGTRYRLNYCLETFSQAEPEFSVELANRVFEEWGKATPDDKIIFDLAATVEAAPCNHYADMVEYFSTHVNHRDCVELSIHPHNDRGTAVAAAELALLAGGERIEGCLLGNGERTGNVDLITLALNLYSQGISPNLDFSNLAEVVEVVCRCNEMAVPVRYPYAGSLVFTAFAGTHQDAIKKGLDAQQKRWATVDRTGEGTKYWAMPYVPLDPKDLGFGYENLIRVSSQSGKAGAAHVIKEAMQLDLPKKMQVSFYKVVQAESERLGKEMTRILITDAFKRTYHISAQPMGRLHLHSFRIFPLSPNSKQPSSPVSDYSDDPLTLTSEEDQESLVRFEGELTVDGKSRTIRGDGKGAALATINALSCDLGLQLTIHEFSSQSVNPDSYPQQKTATYLEASIDGSESHTWGVGISSEVVTSKCRAIISAANAIVGDRVLSSPRKVFTPRPVPASKRVTESWLHGVMLRAGHDILPTPEKERRELLTPPI